MLCRVTPSRNYVCVCLYKKPNHTDRQTDRKMDREAEQIRPSSGNNRVAAEVER